MEIIKQTKIESFKTYFAINGELTAHFSYDRRIRHNNIISHIGDGKYITSFECDTNHPNGNEIHSIFDNGIIMVQNARTKKIVTELIARPGQIKRYWTLSSKPIPANIQYIINKCHQHEQKGYNEDKWD